MLKYDFHVHSEYSRDSRASIEDILKQAVRCGLDGIAVCDHDNPEGGFAAKKAASECPEFKDLVVIPGFEVSTAEGHILILNYPEDAEKIPPGLSPEETVRRAKAAGAFVIIPHPFRKSAHGIGRIQGIGADAVETFNAKSLTNGGNKKAKREAIRLNIPQTGGSDAHTPDMVGRGFTLIDAPENTPEAVLKAIAEGRSSSSGKTTPPAAVLKQMLQNAARRIKKAVKGDYKEW